MLYYNNEFIDLIIKQKIWTIGIIYIIIRGANHCEKSRTYFWKSREIKRNREKSEKSKKSRRNQRNQEEIREIKEIIRNQEEIREIK